MCVVSWVNIAIDITPLCSKNAVCSYTLRYIYHFYLFGVKCSMIPIIKQSTLRLVVNIFILEMSCNAILPCLWFGCCMTPPKVSGPFCVYHPSVSIAHLGLKPCSKVRIFSALVVGPVTRIHVIMKYFWLSMKNFQGLPEEPQEFYVLQDHVCWFFAGRASSKLGNEHEETWRNIKAIPDPDP